MPLDDFPIFWLFVSFTFHLTIPSRLLPYGSCRLAPTNHSCHAVLSQARHLLGIVAYENNYTNLFYNVVDRHYFHGAGGELCYPDLMLTRQLLYFWATPARNPDVHWILPYFISYLVSVILSSPVQGGKYLFKIIISYYLNLKLDLKVNTQDPTCKFLRKYLLLIFLIPLGTENSIPVNTNILTHAHFSTGPCEVNIKLFNNDFSLSEFSNDWA